MYKYDISGYYYEGTKRMHFDFEIEAPSSSTAMQIACGRILMNANAPVTLEFIHYEVM